MPQRWKNHRGMLNTGVHSNHALQSDWSRDGESAFVFVQLELIEEEQSRLFAEQRHIDLTPLHYNLNHRAGSGPAPGYRHSAMSRLKMSLALKGRRKTLEHRRKISEAMTGRPHTAEHNAAIGASHRGRKRPAETGRRISAALKAHYARLTAAGEK